MDQARQLYGPSLRYFAAAASAGSIRAAARELNVASSAVNRQILWLEGTLDLKLFDRVGRGVRLTEAGEILLAHIRRSFSDFDATLGELQALKGLRRGSVTIAAVESVCDSLLPDVVSAFRAKFPGIHVSLRVGGSERVNGFVISGEAEVGFTFDPTRDHGLTVAFQRDLPIGVVMRPDHPLAERKRLKLADCLEFPFCLPSEGLSLRKRLDAVLVTLAPSRKTFVEANSLRFMRALVKRGGVIAFQTRFGIEDERESNSLVFRELDDPPLRRDRFAVVISANRALSLAASMFFDHATDAIRRQLSENDADMASLRA
ncbi:LysR family transcriptional regulator [Rhizobiales bacterium]|nr:LysR family transcriptional regulator [Hongsoonwoonella zoysiae]NRG18817.1 LysR family transcriptional regulator [Hongsoonwoonella zoysiae]